MATSNQILAASSDKELEQRFIAIAASKGIENPRYWVADRMLQLAATVVADGQTVADVYAYADTVRQQRVTELQAELDSLQTPGADLAAVTDTHLASAIDALTTPTP